MNYKIKPHEKILLKYKNNNNNIVFKNLYEEISKTKQKIDNYNKSWDKAKKQANNYEFIYTSSNPLKNVCNINPIASRSYFKILEIVNKFNINEVININNIICIAEGPGGFLQYLNSKYPTTNIYGITLLSKDKHIPYWSPIIVKNKNINLLYGIKNDGDLYKLSNIESIVDKMDKCDLITADGGIDYSLNYNNQELLSYKLLYCEIYTALNLQKDNGVFIIKFFDILYYNTIQLLYILYLCYEEVIIYKPDTSRFSNSEKYIICKKYKYNTDVIKLMHNNFKLPNNLNIYIPLSFIKDIENCNKLYIKKQIENIELIINNINNNTNNNYKKQIIIAKEWCEKYNLPINDIII
jgi:23S rRNA U2552 (ribose-2'-O)-methylase RlmE/FtsJ